MRAAGLGRPGDDDRAWQEGLIRRGLPIRPGWDFGWSATSAAARMNPLAAQVSHIVRKRYSIHGSPDVWLTAPWSDGDCPTMTGLKAGMM